MAVGHSVVILEIPQAIQLVRATQPNQITLLMQEPVQSLSATSTLPCELGGLYTALSAALIPLWSHHLSSHLFLVSKHTRGLLKVQIKIRTWPYACNMPTSMCLQINYLHFSITQSLLEHLHDFLLLFNKMFNFHPFSSLWKEQENA